MGYKKKEMQVAFFMLAPIFVFLLFFYLYPAIFNIKISFTDLNFLKINKEPHYIGFRNYEGLIKSKDFVLLLVNTVVKLTIISVILRLVLGLLIAILLNSSSLKRLKVQGLFRTLILIPWATPPVVTVYVWKWLLAQENGIVNNILIKLGIINNPIAFFGNIRFVWLSITLIIVWNNLPFVVVTLLAAMQSIPTELYEAAHVDGAGSVQSFIFITIPLLIPTFSIVTLLTVFWTFNNFVYVWLTTRGGPGTYTNVLATAIYMKAFNEYKLGYSAAIGVFMSFVMLIFAVFYLRSLVKKGVIV